MSNAQLKADVVRLKAEVARLTGLVESLMLRVPLGMPLSRLPDVVLAVPDERDTRDTLLSIQAMRHPLPLIAHNMSDPSTGVVSWQKCGHDMPRENVIPMSILPCVARG